MKEFQFARRSKEAKEAWKMQENLIQLTVEVERASAAAREEKKRR